MKIVIPVSAADAARLPLHTAVLTKLGGLSAHEVLLFATATAGPAAHEAAEKLRAVCPSVDVSVMDHDPKGGWFQASNIQFYFAVLHLHVSGNRSPFLWCEVDCVPVKENWADALSARYVSGGNPFMGCMVPLGPNDSYMSGCGVYPPGMPLDGEIRPILYDLCKIGGQHPKEPFDRYLRWPFKRRGVTPTNLIVDQWNTVGYRTEGGWLVCDAGEDRPGVNGAPRGGRVAGEAVMVHGCKDDSLYQLVLGSSAAKKVAPPIATATVGPKGPPGDVGPIGCAGLVGPDDSNLNAPAGPEGTPSAPEPEAEPEEVTPAPRLPKVTKATKPAAPKSKSKKPVSVDPALLKATINRGLSKGNVKISAVATELKCGIGDIKPLLKKAGFGIKGPGWLIRVAGGEDDL